MLVQIRRNGARENVTATWNVDLEIVTKLDCLAVRTHGGALHAADLSPSGQSQNLGCMVIRKK